MQFLREQDLLLKAATAQAQVEKLLDKLQIYGFKNLSQ